MAETRPPRRQPAVPGGPLGDPGRARRQRRHVDVGCDLASPVSSDYPATGNAFTGTLHKLRIDLGDDDHSHLIEPEHRLRSP